MPRGIEVQGKGQKTEPSSKLHDHFAYPPRAMRADRGARYLDMSKSKFLDLVERGKLPKPVRIDGVVVWDRLELEAAFEQLKAEEIEERGGKRNTVDMVLGIGGANE